jgi:hypothetical protein
MLIFKDEDRICIKDVKLELDEIAESFGMWLRCINALIQQKSIFTRIFPFGVCVFILIGTC